jgi:hypothetical protein
MTKNETLEAIKKAREAHELQMEKIAAAMEGKTISNPTAVQKTECAFGKWLYDEENRMKLIIGSQFFAALDLEHEKWHTEYKKIHSILFNEKQKKGLFSRMLGKSNIEPLEMDKVKLYYKDLQDTTERLLKALGSAERRVNALSETKFR